MEGDEDKEKNEKRNEWSKPAKGGTRTGCVKHERKPSDVTSTERCELFKEGDDVNEDEDKSASNATSEELKTKKGKKLGNNRNGRNANMTRDNFNDECEEETVLEEFESIK